MDSVKDTIVSVEQKDESVKEPDSPTGSSISSAKSSKGVPSHIVNVKYVSAKRMKKAEVLIANQKLEREINLLKMKALQVNSDIGKTVSKIKQSHDEHINTKSRISNLYDAAILKLGDVNKLVGADPDYVNARAQRRFRMNKKVFSN